ncbi:MAG: phospholipase A [Deltaproteobacteria bacterium]|nr:phospholipase A [Deltaproteobacteria bacterium]MBW2227846.1 phospholipase A [Deltaproteobacteria bacterium]
MWAQGVRLIRWTDKKSNPGDSKFQVSFKYRFFNKKGTLAQKYPRVKGFRFGYTQTSFWDLKSESKRR